MQIVKFQSTKMLPADSISPATGSFSLEDPFAWVKCREQFASRYCENTTGFYFSHSYDYGQNIANFIVKTEEILSVSNKISFSTFSLTNRPYAIWVNPSSFWSRCTVRRSLFTILLRSGAFYDPKIDNYENALRSDAYASQTLNAIKRFLFGYTEFDNSAKLDLNVATTGWKMIFQDRSINEIRNQLKLPKENKVEKTIVGIGSIWN